jgi:hypothetical protein
MNSNNLQQILANVKSTNDELIIMDSNKLQQILANVKSTNDELIIMDLNKLQQIINNNVFTDVEFIITDSSENFHFHKIILACVSHHFYNLFTKDNYKNKFEFRFDTDSAKIFHDVIHSMYKLKLESNKLLCILYNGEFTDVELIIVDPNEKINILVHKIVLACSSTQIFASSHFFASKRNGSNKKSQIKWGK